MSKTFISITVLIACTLFVLSCGGYKTKIVKVPPGEKIKTRHIKKVYAVVNWSDDWIRFEKPVKIVDNQIAGVVIDKTGKRKPVLIPLSEIKRMWVKKYHFGKSMINFFSGITVGVFLLLSTR